MISIMVMNRENKEKLDEIVISVLNLDSSASVKETSRNKNLEWDSLAQVTLISVIENEFEIEIEPSDYEKFTSYRLIELLLKEKYLNE